jgi:hypothetical protein
MSVPGTNRTSNHVRNSVANGGKPDMVRTAHFVLVTMYQMWFSSAPTMVAERLDTLG